GGGRGSEQAWQKPKRLVESAWRLPPWVPSAPPSSPSLFSWTKIVSYLPVPAV
ncbi:hypothetical protein GOP47_0024819, partial [Adiantum capillus-veneris]